MEDWIKEGNKCYVYSFVGWVYSAEATIKRVGSKYFYLEEYLGVKIDINTLHGSYPGHDNICKIYPTKGDFDKVQELKRKRKVIENNVHFLTDKEVAEIYDTIILRSL